MKILQMILMIKLLFILYEELRWQITHLKRLEWESCGLK